ncbi:hypothetical protein AWB71_06088 [Caballeronia peredens]|nr:hypothetical protein AWB71_06088 [Caballeronia peredens]
MSARTGGFLGRLAARAAAGVGGEPALRPDPWRGRPMTRVAGAEDPGPAASEPATAFRTPDAVVAQRQPDVTPPSIGSATALPPFDPYTPPTHADRQTKAPGVAMNRDAPGPVVETRPHSYSSMTRTQTPRVAEDRDAPGPVVTTVAAARQSARHTTDTAPADRPRLPVVEIAARTIDPVVRAPTVAFSSEPEAPGPAALEITIGRIELHNAPAPVAPRAAASAPAATSGFAAFARLRAGIAPGRR